MSAETIKIPDPIMDPMTTMVESKRPKPRVNSASTAGLFSCMNVRSAGLENQRSLEAVFNTVSWGVGMHAFRREDAPLYLTGAAAACTVVSIAAFEILMGLALAALIVTRQRWRIPPIWLPFLLFVAGTLLSEAVSGHLREGFPQIKKFYVYLMLFLVTTAFRNVRQIRWLGIAWALAASLSAAWALQQFAAKVRTAQATHQDFYASYVGSRITGFMSHWMTFSGGMMIALLVIGAIVFYSIDRRWIGWLIGAGVLISVALLAAYTRSMEGAAAVGGMYLIWFWRRWVVLAVPVLTVILIMVNPFHAGDRIESVFRPNGDLDSNAHPWKCAAGSGTR